MSGANKNLFLGIDIGARLIKAVILEKVKGDKMRLLSAVAQGYMDINETNQKDQFSRLEKFLKKNIGAHKQLRNTRIGISITGVSAFVRLVKIPVTSAQKLRQIVFYETQQQIPFPIKDVVWDFQIYGRSKNQLTILLAAVKKELIDSILNVANNCRLEVEFIDVSNLALYNCLHYFYKGLKEALILDCGAKTTNIIVVNNGKIWTRSLPLGGEDMTEAIAQSLNVDYAQAEVLKKKKGNVLLLYYVHGANTEAEEHKIAEAITGVLTELANEIAKTLNFYKLQHQSEMNFDNILLCGGVSKLTNIDKFFETSLSVKVKKIDYFDTLRFHPNADIALNEVLGPAIGLALRGHGRSSLNINLMPQEYLKFRRLKKKIPYLLGTAVVVCLLLMSFLVQGINRHIILSNYLKKIDGESLVWKKNAGTLAALKKDINAEKNSIRSIGETLFIKQKIASIAENIAESLPQPVWITALDISLEKNKTSLEGKTADDLNNIGEFKERLQKTQTLKNVKIETVGKDEGETINFSFTASGR